jgi:4-amino-4-deoxy-L-arabinose transferase-like glycosyltransferase
MRTGTERAWVLALLVCHLALVVWGAARNSVTFDENFHLPSGYLAVTRGDFRISHVNPPLVKALCALPAIAAGARPPDSASVASGRQQVVGIAFMRANADRYQRVFFAARMAIAALSVLLGLLIWRFSRRLHGPRGALVSLAFYLFTPDVLAHAGLVGMDLATGLALLACVYTWWGFARSGRWRWLSWACAAVAGAALVRFTMLLFVLALASLTALAAWRRWARRPARLWLGLAVLVPTILVALQIGYLGQTSFAPLAGQGFVSPAFLALQRWLPGLRLPLPDSYLHGLDWQALEGAAHRSETFLLGRVTTDPLWFYFPLALLVKWPLGLLVALVVRAGQLAARRSRDRHARDQLFLLLPAAMFLFSCMFLVQLNAGVRYLLPVLPLLCVWLGGLVPATDRLRRGPAPAAWKGWLPAALAAVVAIEALTCAPWYLSFYNLLGGGPGRGDAIVNDSNVDWGQGLIALREEMRRRHIGRVYLTYHGTADPNLYGIAYSRYLGGRFGGESEWLAVSSFYFRGLQQRMTTLQGYTEPLGVDFHPLWELPPVARPARCMYLFHLGNRGAPPPAPASRPPARP